MSSTLELQSVDKSYREGTGRLKVLRGVTCSVASGELVALVGPSGSGKTTLLQIAGLLDQVDAGGVSIAGTDCIRLKEQERTRLRLEKLGFGGVF